MMKYFSTFMLMCLVESTLAAEPMFDFPKLADGRDIVTADLHTHSIFSDGLVWPLVRVEEAVREGIDVLAATEHLEYQRHEGFVDSSDKNASHLLAVQGAEEAKFSDIILVNGAEITRDFPPGHVNAVFVDDANKLLYPLRPQALDPAERMINRENAMRALAAARAQDAFIFWNHPNWIPHTPNGIAKLTPMHKQLIEDGKLHGIEVANGTLGDSYSEEAFQIALDFGLTVLATSDIHGLTAWTHDVGSGGHRPMTLVLARRIKDSIREALFDGKTVAWNREDLIGREEHVLSVLQACLSIESQDYLPKSAVFSARIINKCPLPFTLLNVSEYTLQNGSDLVRVLAHGTLPLEIKTQERIKEFLLTFRVLNTQVRPRENAKLSFELVEK
jgi:hypothetical protein